MGAPRNQARELWCKTDSQDQLLEDCLLQRCRMWHGQEERSHTQRDIEITGDPVREHLGAVTDENCLVPTYDYCWHLNRALRMVAAPSNRIRRLLILAASSNAGKLSCSTATGWRLWASRRTLPTNIGHVLVPRARKRGNEFSLRFV